MTTFRYYNLPPNATPIIPESPFFAEENGEGPGVRRRKQPLAPAEIDQKIEALDAKAATLDLGGEARPTKALNQMEKALIENEKAKLESKRARIKRKEKP